MAKIGWLYLKNGKWDNRHIVTEAWVKKSTTGHINAPFFDQYGYQWWIDSQSYYAAVGYGGQRIYVMPEHNMVVVFASHKAFRKPDTLMEDYILKSVKSSFALPVNQTAHERTLWLPHTPGGCQ